MLSLLSQKAPPGSGPCLSWGSLGRGLNWAGHTLSDIQEVGTGGL